MSECIGSPAQELAEQYLAGSLPESEADRFEDHYFACELCHEHLLALAEIRDGLAREPIAIPAPEPARIEPRQSLSGRILAFPVPLAVLASLAAALLVGAVLVGIQRSTPVLQPGHARSMAAKAPTPQVPGAAQPGSSNPGSSSSEHASVKGAGKSAPAETELASLADLRMPGYQQPQLRGEAPADADHLQFSTGMQAYTQGDCNGALEALAKVPAGTADEVPAKLYSGLCLLKERKLDAAQASLANVVAAGDTPALETARYFLAQTQLLRGNVAGARHWLDQTIALHGDYEERAQKQKALLQR